MARRPRYGGRSSSRKRKRKGGAVRPVALLGLAGLVGLGVVVQRRMAATPSARAPVALATPSGGLTQRPILPAPNGVPPAAQPQAPARTASAPPELVTAFTRLGEPRTEPLIDLRRLAVEFGGTPEGTRAREALTAERERSIARARQLAGQEPEGALMAFSRAYLATVAADARRAMRTELEQLQASAVFGYRGRRASTLLASYTVQGGDSLSKIASTHSTDYRCVKRLNGLRNDRIRVGQKLSVPKQATSIVIFKGDFELVALLGEAIVRTFDVATGKGGATPEGRFTIDTKLVQPDWYAPDGKVYKYGTEENILGTRWLGFANTRDHQGFGIHGTKFPESIGTEASMGCLRLRNADVEELYDYTPMGTRVRIVR